MTKTNLFCSHALFGSSETVALFFSAVISCLLSLQYPDLAPVKLPLGFVDVLSSESRPQPLLWLHFLHWLSWNVRSILRCFMAIIFFYSLLGANQIHLTCLHLVLMEHRTCSFVINRYKMTELIISFTSEWQVQILNRVTVGFWSVLLWCGAGAPCYYCYLWGKTFLFWGNRFVWMRHSVYVFDTLQCLSGITRLPLNFIDEIYVVQLIHFHINNFEKFRAWAQNPIPFFRSSRGKSDWIGRTLPVYD